MRYFCGAKVTIAIAIAARTYTMRFPNGRHPSVNVIRRFDQRLKKNVTMTIIYGSF
jgi:hypothetical protein